MRAAVVLAVRVFDNTVMWRARDTLWTKVKDEYIFHLLINVSVWMDMSIYLLSTLIVVFYRSDTK